MVTKYTDRILIITIAIIITLLLIGHIKTAIEIVECLPDIKEMGFVLEENFQALRIVWQIRFKKIFIFFKKLRKNSAN
jgi:hypothetical protein